MCRRIVINHNESTVVRFDLRGRRPEP